MKERGLYITDPKLIKKIVASEGLENIYNS